MARPGVGHPAAGLSLLRKASLVRAVIVGSTPRNVWRTDEQSEKHTNLPKPTQTLSYGLRAKIQDITKHDRRQWQFFLYCIITAANVDHMMYVGESIIIRNTDTNFISIKT